MSRLVRGAAALLVLTGWAAAPASAQRGQPGFSDTAEIVAIEVPVQVVQDGRPVRGLTAENFEVYDGRRKQAVTGFEVVDLGDPATLTKGAVPPAARRHFLLLFDLSFAEPKSVVQARRAATELVLDHLHPADLAAVATYTASKGPALVLGFTSDRRQVEQAIATLGVPELVDRNPDPLMLTAASARQQFAGTAPGASGRRGGGSEGAASARESMQDVLLDFLGAVSREADRANRENQKNKVEAMSRGLADLARVVGGVTGRKHVVYLSEGFDSSLLQGTANDQEAQQMAEDALNGQIWKVDSEKRFGSTDTFNAVERMLEEFRRADCVIHSVDIGGLRGQGDQGAQRPPGRDSLFQMAEGTGGELYENFNDLGAAMGQMLQRTGVTYLLTFQPDEIHFDGAYHRLRVELKNAPRGARVVHKPGYHAPLPYADRSGFQKLFDAGSQLLGDDAGTLPAAVLAAPFQFQPGGNAYVPVLVEVDGPGLLAGKRAGTVPAEVYAYAFDAQGNIQDYVTQTVYLELAKVAGQLRESGLKFFGHLELPPGDYQVRVLVVDGATGASGLRVVPVTVPAAPLGSTAGPVLLPPFFPEPPGKWLIVRENPRGEQRQAPYPFLLKQEPYIPASLPVLPPGQEAQVALVGYNLGAGDLQMAAKVLTPDGKEVGPGDLRVVEREEGAAPDRLVAAFRPPRQPGEYRLVVALTGSNGKAETSAPFVVGVVRGGRD